MKYTHSSCVNEDVFSTVNESFEIAGVHSRDLAQLLSYWFCSNLQHDSNNKVINRMTATGLTVF